MPKQGGQGKGKPKLKDRNFGKALIKLHLQGDQGLNGRHTKQTTNRVSILDNSNLDDYIISAEMDGLGVEVRKVHQNDAFLVEPSSNIYQTMNTSQFDYEQLKIPRKPSWSRTMTADEVDRREKDSFLEWRREIAAMQENNPGAKVTPFEKNLEVWRQLWRVLERCDMAIQIVDARNPMLYYTVDLMKYASELTPKRHMLLLINKSDFLTEYQRQAWAKYFTEIGVNFAFYSAYFEQEKIDLAVAELAGKLQHNKEVKRKDNAKIKGLDDVEFNLDDINNEDEESEEEEEESDESDDGQHENENNHDEDKVNKQQQQEEEDNDEDDVEDKDDDNDNEHLDNDYGNAVNEEEMDQLAEDITSDWHRSAETDTDTPATSSAFALAAVHSALPECEFVWGDNASNKPAGKPNSSKKPFVDQKISNTAATAKTSTCTDSDSERLHRRCRVLNRAELIHLITLLPCKMDIVPQIRHGGRVCVGMLGYPNVGKSSVINTLLNVSKSTHGVVRVGVSSTPGKTKHFQTLMVNEQLMLCDCPGLVFPTFMRSTGEMLCAGILPINQMRDYAEPADVIASRVPSHLVEAAYGMKIRKQLDVMDNPDRPPTGSEMLCAYCAVKGFITNGTGRWDEFRACKDMLRDFNDGRILYVCPPGDVKTDTLDVSSTVDMPRWLADIEQTMIKKERVAERVALQKLRDVDLLDRIDEAIESTSGGAEPADCEMVFGDDKFLHSQEAAKQEGESNAAARMVMRFDDDSSDDDNARDEDEDDLKEAIGASTQSVAGADVGAGRQHKKLKHWGKKNRKLRDKNPYSDDSAAGAVSYVAYSTNRSQQHVMTAAASAAAAAVASTTSYSGAAVGTGHCSNAKVKRQDPRQAYGTAFASRAMLPHHQVVPSSHPNNDDKLQLHSL